jgi:hypothetical protein
LQVLKEDFVHILRPAQYLKHAQYGFGVVTQSNAERTTIDFDLHGTKKFVTSLMVVELMPGEHPGKPTPPKVKRTRRSPAQVKAKASKPPDPA